MASNRFKSNLATFSADEDDLTVKNQFDRFVHQLVVASRPGKDHGNKCFKPIKTKIIEY
jgi:hypothetical protein